MHCDHACTPPSTQEALLWCIRMRVLELSRGIEAEQRVADQLDALGVLAIAPVLRDLIDTLSTCCTRMIDVRCTCQRLSDDERALLDILSLAQSLDFFQARRLLARFVTPQGADTVIEKADTIAAALLCAGHSLPASHHTLH